MTPPGSTLPSLLAVFAHPDDESLAAGGLLARHADAGARTVRRELGRPAPDVGH